MVSPFKALVSWFQQSTKPASAILHREGERYVTNDGSKFPGGFGPTELLYTDYWTLRKRSAELFEKNLYARGIIRRLVTNEVNTGLVPETNPNANILGLSKEFVDEWTELVESRFKIWGRRGLNCDWRGVNSFAELQIQARLEALISGDVLVVLRADPKSKRPKIQLISGNAVQTPVMSAATKDRDIVHGVEFDSRRRPVAYWTLDDQGRPQRIPAYGAKTGRRLAWLVYGSDRRLDDVRGQPILSLVLQSLKEIDRYRDSVQRKALVNSFLAMFIKKGEDKLSSLPITGGAVLSDEHAVSNDTSERRTFKVQQQMPGMVLEELQVGEEPVGFGSQGTDLAFADFEKTIVNAIGWALEIPPEILTLAFSANYSASQAAINEFRIYLNKFWFEWGSSFCAPIYEDWLLSEVLLGRIEAPGLVDSRTNPLDYDIYGSWLQADWYGSIKPSTDTLKQAKGSKMLVENGWSNNSREARIIAGTNFSDNVARIRQENEQLVEAMRPMQEFLHEFSAAAASEGGNSPQEVEEND